MGLHVYRNTSGYYDTLRANTQVSGWACNAARDTEYNSAAPPTWGRPYCKQWWDDASIGLHEKLINEADARSAGFSGLVVAIAPALASEQQNDAVAKTVLANVQDIRGQRENSRDPHSPTQQIFTLTPNISEYLGVSTQRYRVQPCRVSRRWGGWVTGSGWFDILVALGLVTLLFVPRVASC